MSEQPQTEHPTDTSASDGEDQVVVIGPDGQPIGTIPASALPAMTQAAGDGDGDGERHITELVEQPAKVMRIGSMIRQLLEEVKAAPLDEASRQRLKEIHAASIKELETGLAPELVEELDRLTLPFTEEGTPSEGELRIAQAQLVGLARGPLPRHPDRDLRPADGLARPARADAPRPPGRCRAQLAPADGDAQHAHRGGHPGGQRLERDVPLTSPLPPSDSPHQWVGPDGARQPT